MSFFSRISQGFKNAVSSPTSIVANLATGGLYSVVNENKKAAASAATAGAAAFIASGGNPVAGAVGAGVGAVNAGVNKRSIADSALQSAIYGAGVGIVGQGYAAYSASSKLAAAQAATQSANTAATAGIPGLDTSAPFSVATAGRGVAASSAGSGGILSSITNTGSAILGGVGSAAKSAAATILPLSLYQKFFGGSPPPSGGGGAGPSIIIGGTPTPYDAAIAGGVNPQTGVVVPADSSAPAAPDTLSVILGYVGPVFLFVLIPGGLAYAAWYWWKHRRKG